MDTGGKAYIGKFDRPIDESELLASFGSGRYLLILNDGRGRVLVKTTVVVNSPDSPPRVRIDQIVDLRSSGFYGRVLTGIIQDAFRSR